MNVDPTKRRARWYQNLNRYKIGAIVAAVGAALSHPDDLSTWGVVVGTVLAALAGDKNAPAAGEQL